jgi:uncharacterized repeat protein (TIGR02543 family)
VRQRVILLLCMLIASASTSFAQHWIASVTATAHDHNIESLGYAEYVDDYGNDALGFIQGSHCIDLEEGSPFPSACWEIYEFHHAYSGRFDVWAAAGCHQTGVWAMYTPLYGSDGSSVMRVNHDCVAATTYHLAAYTETNGVTAPSSETGDYPIGTSISLMASPNPGFQFTGWTGDVTSTEAAITVVIDSNKSVTAHFREIPTFSILIDTNVDGSITTLRTEHYRQGTSVTYSPITPSGYRFTGWSGVVNSSQETVTFQMPGQDTGICANFTYDGGGGGGPGNDDGGYNEDIPCFPGIDRGCYNSPIIINFENGGYRLSGRSAPVLFDMVGNGNPRPMGWTVAGADEAFLWLDRNHDGVVNNGAELFGNFTRLQNGTLARNGFEALRDLDSNGDGIIDERDPVWPRLMLWRDLNHNGISDSNEIEPVAGSSVTSIDLHDHWTGRHDTSGNLFRYESLVSIKSDSGHGTHRQPVYDIFFVALPYVP